MVYEAPVACPPPIHGKVYRETDPGYGGAFVYLVDGLHNIPNGEIYGALGFHLEEEIPITRACSESYGKSYPLSTSYATAYAQYTGGMGMPQAPMGSGYPTPPASGSGGLSPSGIIGQLETGAKAHETALLIGAALFGAWKLGLFGGRRRGRY